MCIMPKFNTFMSNIIHALQNSHFLLNEIICANGPPEHIEGLKTYSSFESVLNGTCELIEPPEWIRIRTFDRLAFMRWAFSEEYEYERKLFTDKGIDISFDRSWTWNSPWKTYNHLSHSDSRYNHAYRIFFTQRSSRPGTIRHDIVYLPSENRFFDQDLFILVEKIRNSSNCVFPAYESQNGVWNFESDGVTFSYSSRLDCELIKVIWDIYGGDQNAPILYGKHVKCQLHSIAIGATAVTELLNNSEFRTTDRHQVPQHEINIEDIRKIIKGS